MSKKEDEALSEVDAKCVTVMHSDLPDDLKVEIIALLKAKIAVNTYYYPYPIYTQDQWSQQGKNWWEHITCKPEPNTGSPILPRTITTAGDYNPARDEWEKAQADNVMNQQAFYDSKERWLKR